LVFPLPHFDRLNVIQIMCDQLPYDALGCYGHPLVQTPNIDGLAARGVLCTNVYGQSPVCCPSRASQLSGLYPAAHGVPSNLDNLELMNPLVQLLSDAVYDAGYSTAHFGKWHCLRRAADCKWTEFRFLEESVPVWPQSDIEGLYRRPEDPAFLRYGGLVHAATHPCAQENTGVARITDWSIDFLERFAYQPFFLRVSYLAPHTPVLTQPGPDQPRRRPDRPPAARAARAGPGEKDGDRLYQRSRQLLGRARAAGKVGPDDVSLPAATAADPELPGHDPAGRAL
jgi:arylsulfatase A-like enzyme